MEKFAQSISTTIWSHHLEGKSISIGIFEDNLYPSDTVS